MAIVNNGTQNNLPNGQIPTGYTRPTITTFENFQYKSELTLSILKATVDNVTNSTTMTNIFDDATIGLDKQIVDIVAADFLATATVETFASLTSLTTNIVNVESGDGAWLSDIAVSYSAQVTLFVKAEEV